MPLVTQLLNYILHGEGDFNALALAVFADQYAHCQPYQNYCRQRDKTPEQLLHWQEVPAVSTEVFREVALTTLSPATAQYVFQTSGTSQALKGKHYYHDMTLYDAAIQASFMAGLELLPQPKPIFRILTPAFKAVSTSSLFYMFDKVRCWYGDEASDFYCNSNHELDAPRLFHDLAVDSAQQRPVVLLGTVFSFVNFCDYLQQHQLLLHLAPGSKILETGGLKGRTRTMSREALLHLLTTQLGVAATHCFSEYGMTELSSQCYSLANSPIFRAPPWMPVSIIRPEDGKEVAVGEKGLVQFFDLANYTAVSAIITSDMAIRHAQGFELIGRAPKAVLRGCSTAFEV